VSERKEIIAAQFHHDIRCMLQDGGSTLRRLPSSIRFVLGENKWGEPMWRRFARPIDERVFENETVIEWLVAEPFKGLGADLGVVRTLLEGNPEEGPATIELRRRNGVDLGAGAADAGQPDLLPEARRLWARMSPEQQVAFLLEVVVL
jgi:hypothetical protein